MLQMSSAGSGAAKGVVRQRPAFRSRWKDTDESLAAETLSKDGEEAGPSTQQHIRYVIHLYSCLTSREHFLANVWNSAERSEDCKEDKARWIDFASAMWRCLKLDLKQIRPPCKLVKDFQPLGAKQCFMSESRSLRNMFHLC